MGVLVIFVKVRETFGLPKRTYIWKGGTYPADLTDENGNPDPKAGTEWCFKYGEEEWMDGEKFEEVKKAANTEDKYGNPQTPIGRTQCS